MKNDCLLAKDSVVFPYPFWRGGRAVEGARLEIVYTVKRIEGSNPSLSARSSLS